MKKIIRQIKLIVISTLACFIKFEVFLLPWNATAYCVKRNSVLGGHHSSVVSSAPTILRPQVRIPSTPSMLFSICTIEIVSRK